MKKEDRNPESPRVAFFTLGCRVNQYESDAIASIMKADGFTVVPFGDECDVTIINTCTVTAESDRKSRQHIRRAASLNPGKPVIVTGCFAQISAETTSKIPGVSLVVGNSRKDQIPALARLLLSGQNEQAIVWEELCTASYDSLVLQTPRRARSYIKIEDGCENHCAYCIIPRARGGVRSKCPEDVLKEASALAEAGCPEMILTGIETTAYGADSHGAFSLSTLLTDLQHIPGVSRIGLGSLDPSRMNDRFLSVLASVPAVLPHFHLSLQSGSSSVLRRMRRPYNAAQAMERIQVIRKLMPEAMLTADIIVGFPGETDAEFEETVKFCRKARMLHLHIFPYSIREGTEAAEMPDQIPENIKRQRAAWLAEKQAAWKQELLAEYIEWHRENPVYVLAEEVKNGALFGHSEHYVEVQFDGGDELVGKTVPVCLRGCTGEVCHGEIKKNP